MKNNKRCAGVVLAAGSGKRMGSDTPKQYLSINGKPLLYYSLKGFEESFIDEIIIVTRQEDISFVKEEIVDKYSFSKVRNIVAGGRERYHSVSNGLNALCGSGVDYVFIHDGARPFVTRQILDNAFSAVSAYGAAVSGMPSKDTVKIVGSDGFVASTPNRSSVYIMQTPQVFDFAHIKKCYDELIEKEAALIDEGVAITDDAMVMEHFGNKRVYICEGDYRNIKVTTPEDIDVMGLFLEEI